MTFLQRSAIQLLISILLCGSVLFAQGSQAGTGQQPAAAPATAPPPAPMPAPPPVPVPPVPQSTEAGSGESAPNAKSGAAPPANAAQSPARGSAKAKGSQAAAKELSLAGCIVADGGQYELLEASGERFVLTGKTDNLQGGSAVELRGFFLPNLDNSPVLARRVRTGRPAFSVTSASLLSHSCAIPRVTGVLGAIFGQGGQGTAGEPPGANKKTAAAFPLSSLSAMQSKPSEPTHFQAALVALKKAKHELTAAKTQAGSQGDLALRTVQVAIGHVELAQKNQR